MTTPQQSTVERGAPLLSYLLEALSIKRGAAKNLLKLGAVLVNDVPVRQFDHPLAVGDRVAVRDRQTTTAASKLEFAHIRVVHEDDDLIVLDKPAGLLTVGTANDKTNTLFVRLNEYLQLSQPGRAPRATVVHRLDRETSGLVLFAKSVPVQQALQAAWPTVRKTYQAVVEGRPKEQQGTLKTYLTETSALQVFSNDHYSEGAQLAITHYRVLQSRGPFTLVEVSLETGRKHQIRVHMAELGCRITGDRRYGAKLNPCRRLALHASSLALTHPTSGQPLEFESPLPAILRRTFLWSQARR